MTYNVTLPGPRIEDVCGTSAFILFLSLIEELIRSNNVITGKYERVRPIETPDNEYDFVVVGGGAAGAVIAGRLSENPNWKVLLLEAGTDEPASTSVPGFFPPYFGSSLDWNYATTNESHACFSTNNSCSIAAGKVLGGGTSLNGMTYSRGVPMDYNNWAAKGNDGWTWDEVFPYFRLAEDNGEIERVGEIYHATGGPLSVERFPYFPPLSYAILNATIEKGYNVSEDLNGEQITGFSIQQTTSKNGVRRSSAAAYLRPARNRDNLHVSLNSFATKVLFQNKTATGVEYYQNGELKSVKVIRELIVSAGTIGSPHLLLLSGVGPKEHLEAVGVDVVKDLPGIGENFHDHTAFALNFVIDEPDLYDINWALAAQYLVNQTGPTSSTGLASVMALLPSNATSPDYPDLQLQFYGFDHFCAPGDIGALHSEDKRPVGVSTVNVHPASRGRVSLASNDPFDYAEIVGNYLSEPSDFDVILHGIEVVLSLVDAEALQAYNYTLATTAIEACSNYTFQSTDYWICAIEQGSRASYWHPAGTCKMGPASDSMAVVDSRLRVHGMKGLRVADASIMPQITSGNPGAATMMIGERAAAFIKEDWGYSD